MSDLTTKMGVKPGDRFCLLDPTLETAIQVVAALPSGAMPYPYILGERYDVIFFWPRSDGKLEDQFARLQGQINRDGAIWAIIPKKKHAQGRGVSLSWENMQAAALTTDLVDIKTASFTDEEYGTRFVIRQDRR